MPEPARPRLVLVVAMARNRVIGHNGGMPWSLKSDLQRFRALTLNRPMIMGRRTLESIGRVLDGRDTIVLTREQELAFEGAISAHTPAEARDAAEACARRRGADEIAVVGGAQVFAAFLADADRLALTEIEAEPEGDTFFPPFRPEEWRVIAEEFVPQSERDSADSRFRLLQRI